MKTTPRLTATRAFLAVAALTFVVLDSASAARIVAQPEADYELRLADVQTFPQSTAGYLIFKTCSSCDVTSVTVSADTVYLIGQSAVSLAQFVAAAEDYKQSGAGSTYVFIYYDIASKHINRVVLSHVTS